MILGIDLGTKNTCVGVFDGSSFIVMNDFKNRNTVSSIVSFASKPPIVGVEAMKQVGSYFYDVKRLIGRDFHDPVVQHEMRVLNYDIQEDVDTGGILIKLHHMEEWLTPTTVASIILNYVRKMCWACLGQEPTQAVITVPAYFNERQRHATKEAAVLAGLECIRILNEPTAAALAYTRMHMLEASNHHKVVVFDIGGGTLDVSILQCMEDVIQVISTSGDTHLGGEDFDRCILQMFLSKTGYSVSGSDDMKTLIHACEKAKVVLTHKASTLLIHRATMCTITREEYNEACSGLIQRCLQCVMDAIAFLPPHGQDYASFAYVIMVGGSSRLPCLHDALQHTFGWPLRTDANPDQIVACGAAIQGYMLSRVEQEDHNPYQVLLVDATPMTLGVETDGGIMSTLIPRGTSLPTSKTRIYTTDTDNQTSITIRVYEGEHTMTKHNFHIGEFVLDHITPMMHGKPRIHVTINVSVDGIISVKALDANANHETSMIVSSCKYRMSAEAVERFCEEAVHQRAQEAIEMEKMVTIKQLYQICQDLVKVFHVMYMEASMDVLTYAKSTLQWIDAAAHIDDIDLQEIHLRMNKIKSTYSMISAQAELLMAANAPEDDNVTVSTTTTTTHANDTPEQRLELQRVIELVGGIIMEHTHTLSKRDNEYTQDILYEIGCNSGFIPTHTLVESLTHMEGILDTIMKAPAVIDGGVRQSLMQFEELCYQVQSILLMCSSPPTEAHTQLTSIVEENLLFVHEQRMDLTESGTAILARIHEMNGACDTFWETIDDHDEADTDNNACDEVVHITENIDDLLAMFDF